MKTHITIFVLVAVIASVTAVSAASVEDLAQAQNGFGLGLFSKLYMGAQGKNTIISPTSLSIALSMTCSGAGRIRAEWNKRSR